MGSKFGRIDHDYDNEEEDGGRSLPDSGVDRLSPAADLSWDLSLLAEVDREPVGLAWGRIERSNPEVANLYQMWVAPGHRRFGIRRMLLEAVIAWARAKNARYVELGIAVGNSPAMRLYSRAGFVPLGDPQPFRQGSWLLSQSMRLEL